MELKSNIRFSIFCLSRHAIPKEQWLLRSICVPLETLLHAQLSSLQPQNQAITVDEKIAAIAQSPKTL